MRLHAPKSWHRKAVVTASIVLLAAVATGAFFMLRQDGSAEIRLLEAGAVPGRRLRRPDDESGAGGLRLCNKTASRVGIAIGYKEDRRWTTEGWWNVDAEQLRDPDGRAAGVALLLCVRHRL